MPPRTRAKASLQSMGLSHARGHPPMSIAITDDHKALASTASDFLSKRDARGATRPLLEADTDPMPEMWDDEDNLGWLRLHIAEEHGGCGARRAPPSI